MDAWPVWIRLLWKEFRESGIVLAVGVLLALLLIPYRKYGWVPPVGTILTLLPSESNHEIA
jgi:hypothetical protein